MPRLVPNRVKLILHIWCLAAKWSIDARRFCTQCTVIPQFRCPDPIALAVAVAVKSLAKLHQNTILQPSPGLRMLTDSLNLLPLPAFPQQRLARLSGIKTIPLNVLVLSSHTWACLLRVTGKLVRCTVTTILLADDDQEGQFNHQECIRGL